MTHTFSRAATWRKRPRIWFVAVVAILALLVAACDSPATPAPAAPTEAPAAAPTEAPAEEATETPAEEPTAAPEEEATATPVAEEEATPAPEEEATATPVAEEEATPTPDEEATPSPAEEALLGNPEIGAYYFTIARGCGCHFNRDEGAYAGGNRFQLPDGTVYAANITPHPTTGIGGLSEAEIVSLLRTGGLPGYQLHPIMPYRSYATLSDEDAMHLAAYLLSMEPVENQVPARELAADPAPFSPMSEPPVHSPTDPVARGAMLVALARCSECHTPRNPDGSFNQEMNLAGARINEDEIAWNITPDDATGIGGWSEEELATFLRTGALADGSQVAGGMGMAIERFFNVLTEDDALAIAAYLKSLPPISNDPQ